MRKSELWPTLLLMLLLCGGLFYHYDQVIKAPNSTFMGSSHDGLKNYFTPWYHAKHDSSMVWFEGMNYPYGDHIVFADAQPLLSNSIRVTGLADKTMAIMNLLMLLSLIPTGWLLFRILRRWKVEVWGAALSAAAIAFLSPQLLRMNGHYALAYSFVVPLIWHLSLRFWDLPNAKRSLALASVIFIMGWLHPYYVMISAIFLSAFWLFQTVLAWKDMRFLKRVLHFGLQVILPVLAFFILLKLTDPISDRPSNPYGFEEFHASWRTLFLPFTIFWLSKYVASFQTIGDESWEGIGYVGATGGLIFIVFWFRTLFRIVKTALSSGLKSFAENFKLVDDPDLEPENRKLLTTSLLAGLAIGIFALGFPFSIKPELMTAVFPPIKQFRSLGRFAWAFYYVWSVFVFYLLHRMIQWAKTKRIGIPAYVIAALLLSMTFTEGYLHNLGIQRRVARGHKKISAAPATNMLSPKDAAPWLKNINPNDYSGIILLPFFHSGSENLSANSSKNCAYAFKASLQTGLPLMNVMMSRNSFSQAWSHIQYTLPPYAPLEIIDKMKDPRPVLGIRVKGWGKFDGPYLKPGGQILYEDSIVKAYTISLAEQQEKLLHLRQVVPDSLFETVYANIKSSEPTRLLEIKDYEVDGDAEGYRGGKGKTLSLKDNNLLIKTIVPLEWEQPFIVSFWAKLRSDQLPAVNIGIEELTPEGENLQWDYKQLAPFIKEFDGDWALIERPFKLSGPENTIKVNVTRWKRYPPSLVIDDVMVRSKSADIYEYREGHPIRKNLRFVPLVEEETIELLSSEPVIE